MDGETLARHASGELPVDAVIATVDPDAPGWRDSFRKFAPEANGQGLSPARFRKVAPLSLQVRLIRKNMPWIRTVHVAVADYGHVNGEDLSGCGDVHVVRHEDFIPACELPVFNSILIEWYLHRMPGLSDAFIYFNDDFYPTAPSTMADFVDAGGRTLLTMRKRLWGAERSVWDRLCRRTYEWAKKTWGDLGWPSSPCHPPRLWLADENEETLAAATRVRNPPAGRFRDCGRDVDAVVAFCYATAAKHGWAPRNPSDFSYQRLDTLPAAEKAAGLWESRKFVCVNDAGPDGPAHDGACARLRRTLEILLNDKVKGKPK